MKSFYSADVADLIGPQAGRIDAPFTGEVSSKSSICSRARVAVYDSPGCAPRVLDVEPADVGHYIESLATTVYQLAKEQGGDIPYSVVREVAENLIHAHFSDPVISILDSGRTIRFADRGPGFTDKDRAVLPGFTTATADMRNYIRGVGSGLPIVRDYLGLSGGHLRVEDNLGCGAVVTVTSGPAISSHRRGAARDLLSERMSAEAPGYAARPNAAFGLPAEEDTRVASPILNTRQKQVMALVMESGAAGPSLVSRELGVGVSTAYRDLASLEDLGMIESDGGKRSLTEQGLAYLDTLTSSS